MSWRDNLSTQTRNMNLEPAERVGAERAQTQVTLLQSSQTDRINCSQLNGDKIRQDRERERERAAWTFPQRECSSRGGRLSTRTKGWLSVDGLIKPTVSGSVQASVTQPFCRPRLQSGSRGLDTDPTALDKTAAFHFGGHFETGPPLNWPVDGLCGSLSRMGQAILYVKLVSGAVFSCTAGRGHPALIVLLGHTTWPQGLCLNPGRRVLLLQPNRTGLS